MTNDYELMTKMRANIGEKRKQAGAWCKFGTSFGLPLQ